MTVKEMRQILSSHYGWLLTAHTDEQVVRMYERYIMGQRRVVSKFLMDSATGRPQIFVDADGYETVAIL